MADSAFNPDQYLQSKAQGAPAPTPSSSVDSVQLSQFDPNAYLQNKQTESVDAAQARYGSIPEQGLAALEGGLRGASLGASDFAESRLAPYLPDSISQEFSKEAIRGRQEGNPITAFGSNVAGSIFSPVAKIGQLANAGRVATGALEGAIFGAGNAASEAALGDQDLNAQKLLAHVGMGAAIGTGLGIFSKAVKAAPAFLRGVQNKISGGTDLAVAPVEGAAGAEPAIDPADVPPDTSLKGRQARSLDKLKQQTENLQKYGGQPDIAAIPVKQAATEAAQRLQPEMHIPISEYQLDSLSSRDAQEAYKAHLELPIEGGEILRNAVTGQKKELEGILDSTISNIAPGYEPTSDAFEAGSRAADAFTDVIEANRKELGPAIQALKSTQVDEVNHLPGVIGYLTDKGSSDYANPKISNMFDKTGDTIEIKPYDTGMGIDEATYRGVKQVVNALEKNPNDFEKLFDIREGLSQNVDVTKLGKAASQIANAKAAMMDYIQDTIQTQEPDQAVRDVFAKYAKNEENAQFIEKKFGAQIGSDNFRSLAKGKAEESILGKIFNDSATTQAAKNILPPEKFNQLLADHLEVLRNDPSITDKNALSANKFYSKIGKGNQKYALDQAFVDNPAAYQKIKDALMVMRNFTDDVPLNPSGTAKTFLRGAVEAGLSPLKHLENIGTSLKNYASEVNTNRNINAKLAGIADQDAQLKTVQGILKKVTDSISDGAKDIFKSDKVRTGATQALALLSDSEFKKISKTIGAISSNPQQVMDHMAANTEDLHQAVPNTTQSLQSSLVNGFQFLQSKLPQAPQQFPLSHEWEPSKDQISKFSKYYSAVDQPVSALKQVSNGTLSPETMEALQAVHPKLLSEMRQQVISHMDLEKAKALDYGKKLALSRFLGQPLSQSMTPQMIQSNQNIFNPPLPPPQPQKKPRTNLGGLKNLKISNRTRTQTNQEED